VALIDGVVMGGGVGLAIHGFASRGRRSLPFSRCRRPVLAFSPMWAHRGSCHGCRASAALLCPHGAELNPAEACAAGIATHRVSSARFSELADALCGNVSVDAQLAAFAEKVEEGASDWAGGRPLGGGRSPVQG